MGWWMSMRGGPGTGRLPRFWLGGTVGPDVMDGFATPPRGRPQIEVGDGIVWYATGHQRVFGLATVVAAPENRIEREWQKGRWPWWVATRTEIVIPDLAMAPTLAEAGLADFWVQRMSYRRLEAWQYSALESAIREIGVPAPG